MVEGATRGGCSYRRQDALAHGEHSCPFAHWLLLDRGRTQLPPSQNIKPTLYPTKRTGILPNQLLSKGPLPPSPSQATEPLSYSREASPRYFSNMFPWSYITTASTSSSAVKKGCFFSRVPCFPPRSKFPQGRTNASCFPGCTKVQSTQHATKRPSKEQC